MPMVAVALACFVQFSLGAGLLLQRGPVAEDFSGLHAELEDIKAWIRQKQTHRACDKKANQTMAMIISGQESRLLLSSKLKHVVEPLAELGISVDVYIDVLANTLRDRESTAQHGRVQSNELASMREVLPDLLEQSCSSLQLVNIREERETIDVPPGAWPRHWQKKRNGGYSDAAVINVFRRYSSYKFVLEKISSHEMQRGRKYDFVLVSRDDEQWRDAMPFAELSSLLVNNSMITKDCNHFYGVNDQTLLFDRQGAESILGGMLPNLMDPTVHRISSTHGNAERSLKTFAHTSGVKMKQVPFSKLPAAVALYETVDSQKGPEICLKDFYTCEKQGWDVRFCPK